MIQQKNHDDRQTEDGSHPSSDPMNEETVIIDPIEAVKLLNGYGIMTPPQTVTGDELELTRSLGVDLKFPVVMKIVSREVSHKSDIGGVVLGVSSMDEAIEAYKRVISNATSAGVMGVDGVLVQEMVKNDSGVEFILGAKRDDTFGPTLLFGLGGKLTELYRDIALAVYPWSDADLEAMLDLSGRGRQVLEGYRGGPKIDRRPLVAMLRALGKIMIDHPEIVGIDLNPVILAARGPIALDARVLIDRRGPSARARGDLAVSEELTPLFEPHSIAIVGASENPEKIAGMIAPRLVQFGFPSADLYLVNPNRDTILNMPCYKSVDALPKPVDMACIVVPPKAVEEVLVETGRKGVKASIIFSSGFGEAGKTDVQERLGEIARRFAMRVCGPNTEGVVSPSSNTCATFSPTVGSFPELKEGSIAIVTQSGGIMIYLLSTIMDAGSGISRAVSSANEADLELGDYLNFFAHDQKTNVVGAFLEGVKNGPKFVKAVDNLARAGKPLVVVKAGRSEAGKLAAKFHTGAMTGSYEVYHALFRQMGIVEARDVEEVVDFLSAFSSQPVPRGNRLVVVSASGGANTMLADWCQEMGLSLPQLSSSTKEKLSRLLPDFANLRNPLDLTGEALSRPSLFESVLDEIVDEGDVFLILRVGGGTRAANSVIRCAERYRAKGKAVLTCWMTARRYAEESRQMLVSNRIPMYSSPLRAIRAIEAMVNYGVFQRRYSMKDGDGPRT